jgi:predicted SAM-dependent methyltransferase
MRINVGCGMSPTSGWRNFDNSQAIRLARRPAIAAALKRLGMLSAAQWSYIEFCRSHQIELADARRHIPLPDGSVEVLYSSHMLEHLTRDEAGLFLAEAARVLRPGGILRIAVPDLMFYARQYAADGDLEHFMEYLHLTRPPARSAREKLRRAVVGDRHHQWMYDGPHLCRLLSSLGWQDPRVLPAGETTIPDPGPLDLRERSPESLYVEARNGGRQPSSSTRATGSNCAS